MAKHIIGLKRVGLWVFAMLLVGVYVPGLLPGNSTSDTENTYCYLQKEPSPVPIRVWANKIDMRQRWVAAI